MYVSAARPHSFCCTYCPMVDAMVRYKPSYTFYSRRCILVTTKTKTQGACEATIIDYDKPFFQLRFEANVASV